MMEKLDYKKEQKEFYLPKTTPSLVELPAMRFLMVNGRGDPNDPQGAYAKAVSLLFSLSYTIRMSEKKGCAPEGFSPYAVMPLEGLWWMPDSAAPNFQSLDKSSFCWTCMIRQPEFVDQALFAWACGVVEEKKKLDPSMVRLEGLTEGLCAQVLHVGPYDTEPDTLHRLDSFISGQGLLPDYNTRLPSGQLRRHHELYLTDVHKCSPERYKTVLRTPVRRD